MEVKFGDFLSPLLMKMLGRVWKRTLLKMKTMVISPSLKLPFTMIFTGVAVTVGVSMYVLSISRLSEVDMVMLLPKTTYFYSLYHLLSFKKNTTDFCWYCYCCYGTNETLAASLSWLTIAAIAFSLTHYEYIWPSYYHPSYYYSIHIACSSFLYFQQSHTNTTDYRQDFSFCCCCLAVLLLLFSFIFCSKNLHDQKNTCGI